MTVFSRLVWFAATHHQLAEAAGQDFDPLLAERWFTSSAREKGRATVTTPALSGEEGKMPGRHGFLRNSPWYPIVRLGVFG
jgi:hypothetical protein